MTSIIDSKINKVSKYLIDKLIKEETGSLYEEIKSEWCFHWFQYILDNKDKDWNYLMLIQNPNITWDIIQTTDNPWDDLYWLFSSNPNITWEIILANKDEDWNYGFLSDNKNITWEIVQANQDKPWDYRILSKNQNIT